MPVYATRRIRNSAATLMLLSGLTHVGQLWLGKLDAQALMAAGLGMFYLLIGLGLSGQSRFTLWIAIVLPATAAAFSLPLLLSNMQQPLLLWHVTADTLVASLCVFVLFRTRHADMD